MNFAKLIFSILTTGATLLCVGSLGEAVLDLQKKAAHDTAIGIISIGKWNTQLTETYSHHLPRNRHKVH